MYFQSLYSQWRNREWNVNEIQRAMDTLQDTSYVFAAASGYAALDAECIGALRSLQEGPYVSVVKGPRCVRVLKKESQKPVVR